MYRGSEVILTKNMSKKEDTCVTFGINNFRQNSLIYHSKKHQEKEDKNNKKEFKQKFESEGLKVDHKCNDCERSFPKKCSLN